MVHYVQFDEEGYRDRLVKERKRLEALASVQKKAGYMDLYYVTMGRVSGLSLASSHLVDFTVEGNDRWENEGGR